MVVGCFTVVLDSGGLVVERGGTVLPSVVDDCITVVVVGWTTVVLGAVGIEVVVVITLK